MRARAAVRQYSKSELAKTAGILFDERAVLLAASARRWKRKLWRAAVLAFLLGSGVGIYAARFL